MHKFEISAIKIRNALNQAFPNTHKAFFSSAIITAGGCGNRMGGVAKQFLDLNGAPCILYSLLAFQNCEDINEIVVVVRAGEEDIISSLCHEHGISKLSSVAVGGKTRQESVARGFSAVSPKSDFVAIHDAARPLLLPEHISKLLSEARRYGASCAAKRVSDTIKRCGKNEMILETVPRDDLYAVQTPQVFKSDLYRVSLGIAERDGFEVTDDCSLAEHAGFSIKLCDLGAPNFKLTTPDDLLTIGGILKERENG